MLELLKRIDFINIHKLEVEKISEKKYLLKNDNEKYILQIFPFGKYEKIKKIMECLKTLNDEFKDLIVYEDIGKIDELYSYRIIKSIKDEKNELDYKNAYEIGLKIGKFIYSFHKYFATRDCGRWSKHYNYRINRLKHEYGLGYYRGNLDYIIFDFLHENKFYIGERHCTTIMGINSMSDIIVTSDGRFQILEEYKILRSDPYFEFKDMNYDKNKNDFLLTGIVDGYFNNNVPRTFFKLLAVYTIIENLYGIFSGEFEDVYIQEKISEINEMYDRFSTIFPLWYINSKEKIKGNDKHEIQ